MSAALKVLIVAEGPSEIGELDALAGGPRRGAGRCEGFVPPMLRKLLGVDLEIDAQRVSAIGRFKKRPRLPGHGDRAAQALVLAATQGYGLLVFVKDVDRYSGTKRSAHERRKKQREMHQQIEQGFNAVAGAGHVERVKATPCRMIEAWALGDADAVVAVAGERAVRAEVPDSPEDLWGDERDPRSKHPKCVLRRALGADADRLLFEQLAVEANPDTLRRSCPDSFALFVDEVARVKGRRFPRSGTRIGR